MYSTRYDFDTNESQVVQLIVADGEQINGTIIYADAVAMTGIDYDAGVLYGADGQLPPPYFGLVWRMGHNTVQDSRDYAAYSRD